ncbi:MAG TPA: ArsA-related P-loop ATPase [Acidimicrobiales bacterium]|nr:ArsA-related P-loop ATPase [Acidimicrobiales bacterium]
MAGARIGTAPAATLEQLLAAKEIVVTCGAGGVGKTTTAAALAAMAAVHLGGNVLVLTVDPARRLADALGLEALGNVERQVDPVLFTGLGLEPRGELWAAMLDTKASWDDLIRRQAPDAATRDAILANPLYTNITGRFVQSHDYVAMERLHEVHASGRYDLIVVDTPPSRSALDLLDAPGRMTEFFAGRLIRWLTAPYRSRVFSAATRPLTHVADRILGARFLSDITEFFVLLQSLESGFVARAAEVQRVLADRRTTFCVVTTLEPAPTREAGFFVAELAERRLHLGAVVVNKALPDWICERAPTAAAEQLRRRAGEVAGELAGPTRVPAERLERVVRVIGDSYANYSVVANREAEQRAELSRTADVLVTVPLLEEPVHDLAGLLALGEQAWR